MGDVRFSFVRCYYWMLNPDDKTYSYYLRNNCIIENEGYNTGL